MRPIKFRVWDKKSKEMFHFHQVSTCSEYNLLSFDWDWKRDGVEEPGYGELEISNDFILMQFSGLLDRNDKEIYSGDVVQIYGYGKLEIEFPFRMLYEAAEESDKGEIIGNIYQNPDLIK